MDARGGALIVPDVGIYHPSSDRWFRGADLPIPVGDSVVGVYRDRYIYLVSGRSNKSVVSSVQVYDTDKDKWSQATPIPGPPVFGHAGALVDDTIIYVDGAGKNPATTGPRYVASDECWMGKIDHHDPTKIEWTQAAHSPRRGALPHRGRRFGERSEDLLRWWNRQSVRLQRHRLRRQASGALSRDLRLQPAHRKMGNHRREHSRSNHGSSRTAGDAGGSGAHRRHGKRTESHRAGDAVVEATESEVMSRARRVQDALAKLARTSALCQLCSIGRNQQSQPIPAHLVVDCRQTIPQAVMRAAPTAGRGRADSYAERREC